VGRLNIRQTQSLQTRQEYKLIVGIEQANLLEMPEEEFNRLAIEVETSPLFKRLWGQERLIRYQRCPRTDVSPRFYELNEEIAAGPGSLDVESVLSGKEEVVRHIQRIGRDKFERYFLYPEPEVSVEETARECRLEMSQVEKINELINEFSIMSEFYNPSALGPADRVRYSKVASVERRREGFVIGYMSPVYARGKYSIDYQRFEELMESGTIAATEAKEVRQLFKRLECLNARKDTLTRILHSIVEKQATYFESGKSRALLPFTQKELARRIGLVPSSISRAIGGRSLETPWGEERALKDFFARPRMFRKELVRQLLGTREGFASDEAIRARLEREFGVSISRRSVASLRKELKVAAARKRNQPAG
jgi:transposase